MLFDDVISELSKSVKVSKIHSLNNPQIRDIAFLDGVHKDFMEDTIYFGLTSQISEYSSCMPNCCIIADITEDNEYNINNLASVTQNDLFVSFNLAKNILGNENTKSSVSELMAKADELKNIDSFLNYAAIALDNALVLIDENFKIVSHSASIPVVDPIWSNLVSQGYCSYEFMVTVNSQIEPETKSENSVETAEVSCDQSPNRKFRKHIYFKKNIICTLLMVCCKSPANAQAIKLFEEICDAVKYVIFNYEQFLLVKNSDYERFLYDLLIGATKKDLSAQLTMLNFSPRLIALDISPMQYLGASFMSKKITKELKSVIPNIHVTYYNGNIAALMQIGNKPDISNEDLVTLQKFAENFTLNIGVSPAFSNVMNFSFHYHQAERAITFSKKFSNCRNVHCYIDYQFYDLLSEYPTPENLGLYCHPSLTILRKYDLSNKQELYKTLSVYLKNGCKLMQTAKELFIHRNTLSYRIDRIQELCHIDLNNPDTCFYLRIAYMIDTYLGHDA